MELSQGGPPISSDPSTKGFDLSAGTRWIYPLNYQFREYQYNIARNALYNNTLVCLPTGLGKTLIAAVVMYNFWRWYPRGKIVFLAPTKPLVAQQISACHDIMGIPSTDTIELTGLMNPKNREVAWFTKRVIFATPQVFQNDLEKNIASGELVRCVVIDEAHKALGKHAYCESLRLLQTQNACFRVLALSATPGSRLDDVCQVMKNLLISNLELRDETSPDILPYLNKRQMDIILVPLDKDLARFKEAYVSIMDRWVRLLVQYNVIKGDASTISKGRIFYLYKEFQSKTNRPGNYGQIMRAISRCMSLYHAYDLLIRHGLRAFTNFCQTHSADIWMTDEPALQNLLDEILSFLGPFPTLRPLPDGSVEEIPKNLVFGHTKFYKLKNLLVEHFEKFAAKNEETRAIVFVEYRDSVNEVYVSLLQSRPMLRPKMFVGQVGQKRKQQMQAMEAFRNNEANVLISTSVGEEGLDVGEVDLIVCFDISQSSPIRLVQRMGRTGRRRDGRIVMLVTDGKEHQALKSTIAKRDSLNKKVLHSSNVISAMYQESPRMVPPDLDPECSKMHIVLQPKTPAENRKRKRKEKGDGTHKENKKKATVAKTHAALPSEVEKGKSMQSLMLKFLSKPSTSKEPIAVSTQVTQTSQANQPPPQISQLDSIKLLTDDTAALEFLTLCAIKASKLDSVRNELNRMDETYLAKPPHNDMDNFLDYPLPDFDVLNCIAYLEERTEESPAPEINEDFEFDQIDDNVYLPEHDHLNDAYDQNINDSPAVGKFNYEDLFNDSCDSDEMALLDDHQGTTLDDNLIVLPDNEESRKCRSNNVSKNTKERLSQNERDYAALRDDDYCDKPRAAERLLDQVSHTNKEQCEEENNLLKIGCFESILDQSSDSDIPSSQSELDSRRSTETLRSNSVSKKQNGVGIEKSTNKPQTSSGSHAVAENQNKMYPLTNKTSKSSTNILHRADSDLIEIATLNLNSSKINTSVDINKPIHCNGRKASRLPNVLNRSVNINMDTSSGFLTSEHNERSDSRIGFNFKTPVHETVVKPVNPVINKTSSTKKNLNEYFEEPLDEDDDVIFVSEVSGITVDDEITNKSIDKPIDEDDDDVVFEKEVSFAEKKKANESNADSSETTITQIIELIENSKVGKLNLGRINKNSQSLLNPNKLEVVNASSAAQSKKGYSLHDKTASKNESKSTDAFVSCYFSKENHVVKDSNGSLKPEELLEADLDLSEITWENSFAIDEKHTGCKEVSVQIHEELNSDIRPLITNQLQTRLPNNKKESFKTNSDDSDILLENKIRIGKSITDRCQPSLLNKKEESFQTNSDDSDILLENMIQIERSITDRRQSILLNKKEESFKTNSNSSAILLENKNEIEETITNRREPSLFNKKGESFNGNFDDVGILSQSNLQTIKSSPPTKMDFDLGDYEWDSDFESPANPVVSLKQFHNSNKTLSPNKLNDVKALESGSKRLSTKSTQSITLSSFAASTKKKLSTEKSKMLKPSTSRDHINGYDSDFEEDFFHKLDGKSNIGNNHNPKINYVSTLNGNPLASKENVEPNSGLLNLSSFSASRKDRDVRKVPLCRGVTIADRAKCASLDRDQHKRKKHQVRNRIKPQFLDLEAQIFSDTSSGTSGEDDDLQGFVSHTQHVPETVDMQQHYLQSIKDVHNRDAFHFKQPRAFVPDDEVFSQPMSQRDESGYVYDSFCVSGEEDDLFTETHEDSLLELSERALNSKKRKHSKNGGAYSRKKQKVAERLSDSNSSEDETEKLREQILEESMIMKRNKN